MRIALVWPHDHTIYQTLPLSLGILYSSVKDQGHDVRLFNLPLEGWKADTAAFRDAIVRFQPQLVGLSAWAVSFRSAVAAAAAVRASFPGAVTLCGGTYPTLNPEQAWASGRLRLPVARRGRALLSRAGEGARRRGSGRGSACERHLPSPHRRHPGAHQTRIAGGSRQRRACILGIHRAREGFPPGYVATVPGPHRKAAIFAKRGCARVTVDLYRAVQRENLDEEMLHLEPIAGFKTLTIAPESGSDRVRKLMEKDMRDADIRRAAAMIRAAGLSLQGYFKIGYPGETSAERRTSYDLIYELGLDVFGLHKFMPLPGTASFLKLIEEGRITRDYLSEAHFVGEERSNLNGELPANIDREILFEDIKFYARHPWKIIALLRLASAGGPWRAFSGATRRGMLSLIGRSRPMVLALSIREPMQESRRIES